MSSDVIGQFVTPQNSPTIPHAAASVDGIPSKEADAHPKAAPMQKEGTISPPLNPAAIVNVVKIIFNKNASNPTLYPSSKMEEIRDMPEPRYTSV